VGIEGWNGCTDPRGGSPLIIIYELLVGTHLTSRYNTGIP